MDEQERVNELAIVGDETADHTVSIEVLTRALSGMQRIVYLMAASAQDLPIGDRFNPSDELRRRYALRCGVPLASSFALPLQMDRRQSTLFPLDDDLLSVTFQVFALIAERRSSELNALFSRPKYLNRVLSVLREMLPRSGERWGVRLRVDGEIVTLNESASRYVGTYLSSTASQDATMTVTGELLKVNIELLRLVIRYPPTRKEITCQCEASVFDTVMKNYDVPIQVTGLYTLDRKGDPVRLTGVTRVEPIDLSPLTFSRVEWAGRVLVLRRPLVLEPRMDEDSGQFYILTSTELGIDVFARTRDELSEELAEQLLFQWDTYAKESPNRLSRGAQRLREALLARVHEEVGDATPEEGR